MEEADFEEKGDSFTVVLLGIVFDPEKRQILIAKKDQSSAKKLGWVFPGGRATPEEKLEDSLRKKIKEKTGYDVEILGSIHSRIPPERKDIIMLHYLCEVIGGKENDGIKWVKPQELNKYFINSFEPPLNEYIINLG